MGFRNVELQKLPNATTFRKIAMGTWRTAKDPTVYGQLDIDFSKAQSLIDEYQKKHDIKITPVHLVAKALAFCMERRPEINGMIRGSKIYLRKDVNIFFQVNIPGEGGGDNKVKKANLAGAVINKINKLSTADIAKALKEKASKVRTGKDKEIKKNMSAFKFIPWRLTGLYLDFISWLIYGLNLNLSFLGIPKDPFGSAMITNVGSMGIDMAWAPLCPYTRVPFLFTVGAVSEKPWVEDGELCIKPILPLAATFDHRLIDGVHAAQISKDFKMCFAEPEKYLFN